MTENNLPPAFRPLDGSIGIRAIGWFKPDTTEDWLTWAIEWADRVQSPHRIGRLEVITKDGSQWAYSNVPTQEVLQLFRGHGLGLNVDELFEKTITSKHHLCPALVDAPPSDAVVAVRSWLVAIKDWCKRAWHWVFGDPTPPTD